MKIRIIIIIFFALPFLSWIFFYNGTTTLNKMCNNLSKNDKSFLDILRNYRFRSTKTVFFFRSKTAKSRNALIAIKYQTFNIWEEKKIDLNSPQHSFCSHYNLIKTFSHNPKNIFLSISISLSPRQICPIKTNRRRRWRLPSVARRVVQLSVLVIVLFRPAASKAKASAKERRRREVDRYPGDGVG